MVGSSAHHHRQHHGVPANRRSHHPVAAMVSHPLRAFIHFLLHGIWTTMMIIIIVAKIKVTLSHKNVVGALYTSHSRKYGIGQMSVIQQQ